MSVCDPEGGMHELWQGVLQRQVFADAPPVAYEESYAEQATKSFGAFAKALRAAGAKIEKDLAAGDDVCRAK